MIYNENLMKMVVRQNDRVLKFKADGLKRISIKLPLCLWAVLGLITGISQGCAGLPTQPVVAPMVSEKENLPTNSEAKGHPFLTKTFVWTVRCEAEGGQTCEGHPVLSFPSDQTYCRYDYQIMEGPVGKTEQVISVENDSSLKVYIKAVGGPFWNPYISKIVLRVLGLGIAPGTDLETRRSYFCNSLL